jgi:hypothetical protein
MAVVFCLLAGLIGCASAPKYAENSEVPWEVFYSVRTKPYETFVSDSRRLPTTFFIGGFIVGHGKNSDYIVIRISSTEQGSEEKEIFCSVPFAVREDFQKRLESGKKYQLQIEKKYPTWTLVGVDGVSLNEIIAELQVAEAEAKAERQRIQAEEKRKKEKKLAKPRFSPEGKEYIKRTLLQAVGDSKNQANRGKTLFFESSRIKITDTGVAGQYLVDQLISGLPFETSGNVIMEYYGRIPTNLGAALLGGYGYIMLYRIEINQLGVARFVIDSFRE